MSRLAGTSGVLALASGIVAVAMYAAAAPGPFDPARVEWKSFTMRASKLALSSTATVELDWRTRSEVATKLIGADRGEVVEAAREPVALVTVTTDFLNRHSVSRVWFDPLDGRALQRVQHESGGRNRYKVNRFTDLGAWTVRRNPEKGERDDDPEQWSDHSARLEPYPESALGGDLVVVEPGALLYLAAAAPLEQTGDRLELTVLSRRKLSIVSLVVEGRTRLDVEFEERRPAGARTVDGAVDALHISARARPFDPQAGGGIELIGLEGDVDIFLDPERRVPVEIHGRAPVVGNVKVRLLGVVMGR